MATVATLLAGKGTWVHTISPTATVIEATRAMNRRKIGALVVVVRGGQGCNEVVGMFTERDVLMRIVAEERDPANTLVEEVMTTDVIFARPETAIDEIGAVMRERRIRHVPVCVGKELGGMISMGDINAWHAQGLSSEIHHLNEYIHGRV